MLLCFDGLVCEYLFILPTCPICLCKPLLTVSDGPTCNRQTCRPVPVFYAGSARISSRHMAAASGWGLLRNAFQEFSGASFVGADVHAATPASRGRPVPPGGTDSFGAASTSGAWYLPRVVHKPQSAMAPLDQDLLGASLVITGALSLSEKSCMPIFLNAFSIC